MMFLVPYIIPFCYVSIGYYLALSFYYIALFLGRKHDKSNFYYGMMLFGLSAVTILKLCFVIHPSFPMGIYLPLSFYANFIAGSFLIYFANCSVGSIKYHRQIRIIIIFISIWIPICLGLYYITGNEPIASNAFIIPSFLLILPFVIKVTVHFFKEKLYHDVWRNRIFWGIIVFTVFYMASIILICFDFSELMELAIINLGSLFLTSITAFSLASQFNREHTDLEFLKERLEYKVKERTQELEIANSQRTNTFINLAHEIKTPLTLLNNSISKAIQKAGRTQELIEMKYSIDLLLSDAVNFLDSEKLLRGQIFYSHDSIVDLSNIVIRKIQLFRNLADDRNIKISYSVDNELFIKIDTAAIDRVINNLLDNAIKYNCEHGTINISLHPCNNDRLELIISNTGRGISEEEQKAIFDPYYQTARFKRNIQGIGMGLFITDQIIKSVGGEIAVSSILSKSTTFKIAFPRYNKIQEVNRPVDLPISMPPDEPTYDISDYFNDDFDQVLLVLEDNTGLLSTIRNALIENYNIICARNGVEAFSKLEKYPDLKPDLIISDIMMDQMDGNEFLSRISKIKIYNDVPFIFLSAKTTESENIEGLKRGAIDYIFKPFSIDILLSKVEALLNYARIKKTIFQEDKYRSMGLLASTISHEILNPLSGISGPLYILQNKLKKESLASNDVISEAISLIRSNTDRISKIVTTMRSLFHGDEFKIDSVEVSSIVPQVIDLFQNKIGERIKFINEIHNGFSVSINSNALVQILINLISNGIDAIPDKGTIKISTSQTNGIKKIMVTDTGKGIDARQKKHIFEFGYTSKKGGKGTGIGLFVVKELCKACSINITFDTKVGGGTTFILAFS